MSDADLTQSPTGEGVTGFASVLSYLTTLFECADSSPRHARLIVELPEGTQPVMVYRGTSSMDVSREVVHIASPLFGVSDDKLYAIAEHMDDMPLGALRRLGGIAHVHDALACESLDSDLAVSYVRLMAAQALSMISQWGEGA